MPTHNPNLPSYLNRRVLAHKRAALSNRNKSAALQGAPSENVPKTFAGVMRSKTVSMKRARKQSRNKNYAFSRKKEMMAEELLRKNGEVDMVGMYWDR
jgi:hypothetical protein